MLAQIPSAIRQEIQQQLNCVLTDFHFFSGGCINNGGQVTTTNANYFLKWNDRRRYPEMFSAEARGLRMLASANAIRIPQVVLTAYADDFQFLLLELIVHAQPSGHYWHKLGEQLAALHRRSDSHFGLDHDNYIGSIPQRNTPHETWSAFFQYERLQPQVELAVNNGKLDLTAAKRFDLLYNKLPVLIADEKPALIHGDLWSGNLIVDEKGDPCLIDPAIYFGHREAEIAFTRLFGGFSDDFYSSYHNNFPLEPDFTNRADLYNLYPLLVHVNLFGGSYIRQVVSILNHYV